MLSGDDFGRSRDWLRSRSRLSPNDTEGGLVQDVCWEFSSLLRQCRRTGRNGCCTRRSGQPMAKPPTFAALVEISGEFHVPWNPMKKQGQDSSHRHRAEDSICIDSESRLRQAHSCREGAKLSDSLIVCFELTVDLVRYLQATRPKEETCTRKERRQPTRDRTVARHSAQIAVATQRTAPGVFSGNGGIIAST